MRECDNPRPLKRQLINLVQWKNTGGLKQKHKKTAF